jgi:hypothetical protein
MIWNSGGAGCRSSGNCGDAGSAWPPIQEAGKLCRNFGQQPYLDSVPLNALTHNYGSWR